MKKGVEQKKKEPKAKKGGLFQSLRVDFNRTLLSDCTYRDRFYSN